MPLITTSRVRVEGLRELLNTMQELPKATQKNTLKKILLQEGAVISDTMRNLAPDDPNTPNTKDLKGSIGIGTKLGARQARLHRKEQKQTDEKHFAEVFAGAGVVPQAHLNEFGTVNMSPQPFARPAWEENKEAVLNGIADNLWAAIDKSVQRHRRKMAKKAGG